MSSPAAGLIAAAAQVQQALSDAGFSFCFIGGLALQRWGEQRYTRDVDVTLLCEFGAEERAAQRLAAVLEARIPQAVAFASEARVFLARTRDGTPVDISLGAIGFEVRCVQRASRFEYAPGTPLVTCGAEDLVVMKAFAGRSQDWPDIEGIVMRQGGRLDWSLIDAELTPLLAVKDPDDTMERLARLRPGH